MKNISEVENEIERLSSKEGRLNYLQDRTLLSRERVQRIDEAGSPWPMLVKTKPGDAKDSTFRYLESLTAGDVSTQGETKPHIVVEALSQMIEMENEERSNQREEYETAIARGENPDLPPELMMPEETQEHLMEVVRLSGESFDVVYDIYRAHLFWFLKINELEMQKLELKLQSELGETD